MSSIAITGVSGYLGQKLLPLLEVTKGYERIIGIDIVKPKIISEKLRFYQTDTRSPEIIDILKKNKVDTLIHLAFIVNSMQDSRKMHDMNIGGARNVFKACKKANIDKIVVCSSSTAYGAHPDNPEWLYEHHPLRGNPKSQYALDKVTLERMCEKYINDNPETVLIRLRSCAIIGPNANNYISRFFTRSIIPAVKGYNPEIQFVHEDDVVDAFSKALKKDEESIYNVTGDGTIPLFDIVTISGGKIIQLHSRIIYPVIDLLWKLRLVDAPSSQLDFVRYRFTASNEKIKEELKFKPRYTSEEAFRSMVEKMSKLKSA